MMTTVQMCVVCTPLLCAEVTVESDFGMQFPATGGTDRYDQ
jgi:hypothetical protein